MIRAKEAGWSMGFLTSLLVSAAFWSVIHGENTWQTCRHSLIVSLEQAHPVPQGGWVRAGVLPVAKGEGALFSREAGEGGPFLAPALERYVQLVGSDEAALGPEITLQC